MTATDRDRPSTDDPPRRVAVVGHGALSTQRVDGQTLRTRLVIDELRRRLGEDRVQVVDTGSLPTRGIRTVLDLLTARATCGDLVVMPNTRGLRVLLPLYARWARRGRPRVHYLVVGGWLPRVVNRRPRSVNALQELQGIYVQSNRMVRELEGAGLRNVALLPNFRRFPHERERSRACGDPFRFVFLSRIMPEKGVEHAIEAVQRLNVHKGAQVATLDLWGPLTTGAQVWFERVMQGAGAAIRYRGVLAPETVVTQLPSYDMMLFPTYYSGEAFPGVIIDAMVSGIPVIASDWQDNPEFVEHGKNGLLFKTRDVDELTRYVLWSYEHPEEVMRMKHDSAKRADAFHVDVVMPELLTSLDLTVGEATGSRNGDPTVHDDDRPRVR